MYHIVIQQVSAKPDIPKTALLRRFAEGALSKKMESAEITIRIVDTEEMSNLNSTYRHKKGPTNVLTFPFTTLADVTLETPLLGDIIICAEVVNREALEQKKSQEAHWAHMIVHSICHLLGYDHDEESEAERMESLEIEILQELGFPNPYESGEHIKDND